MQLAELAQKARPFAPLAVIAAAVAAGFARGLGFALLVLAGGMLLLAISFLWESIQSLGDDSELTLDEALALAAPSAEEEKKRAVLRALKDLEYERGVGKVSDEDYQKLSAHYREEAKQLLQALERSQTPARERAEKLAVEFVEKELGKAVAKPKPSPAKAAEEPEEEPAEDETTEASEGEEPEGEKRAAAPSDDDGDESADEDDGDESADEDDGDESADEDDGDEPAEDDDEDDEDDEDEDEEGSAAATAVCASCKTQNDDDARFCKKCGESLK